ncbi:hypothetical protein [Xanthomonas fragariae]|uniref:hypothetical protein n=1 Tax=Xanthomonas fragariae TaxID=48664 RepID=UPI003CCEBFD5
MRVLLVNETETPIGELCQAMPRTGYTVRKHRDISDGGQLTSFLCREKSIYVSILGMILRPRFAHTLGNL